MVARTEIFQNGDQKKVGLMQLSVANVKMLFCTGICKELDKLSKLLSFSAIWL